jgi:ABC-type antimicrobial peptide transport system permease subunit
VNRARRNLVSEAKGVRTVPSIAPASALKRRQAALTKRTCLSQAPLTKSLDDRHGHQLAIGAHVIFLSYAISELRRRWGRTLMTALGLGVGVGLVLSVSALSAGLDRAQTEILAPLVGVGTDMTVTRPLAVAGGDPRTAFQSLSAEEREQLRSELGGGRIDFSKLEAGSTFSETVFRSSQLSVDDATVATITSLDGVATATGGLQVSMSTISGTVPDLSEVQSQGGFAGPGDGAPPPDARGGGNASFNETRVAGVDPGQPSLGAVTSGQVSQGRYFTESAAREAILDLAYAKTKDKQPGDTITLDGKGYTVVGLAETPLGGQASDVYVKLDQLQALSGRKGRVNVVYVRATDAASVPGAASAIERTVDGASVTTAESLASSVTGSLASAGNLVDKLGLALQVIGLGAAILIASLLTLSSVGKRVRELGTLRAIGWSRWLVVRQISGESLLQGVLGALVGILVALGVVAAISALGPSLTASVGSTPPSPGFGPFGQGTVSQSVELVARLSPGIVAIAAVLAVVAGLLAGAAGALRASRLRPVEALRHLD